MYLYLIFNIYFYMCVYASLRMVLFVKGVVE